MSHDVPLDSWKRNQNPSKPFLSHEYKTFSLMFAPVSFLFGVVVSSYAETRLTNSPFRSFPPVQPEAFTSTKQMSPAPRIHVDHLSNAARHKKDTCSHAGSMVSMEACCAARK